MASKEEDFDPKNSLVYMNSTAALMETMFKNMKDEDFVYPTKKQVSADEGAIIRSEEHLKRQKESAMQHSYIIRDTYLESVLAKMTDEDFTYGSKAPVDPNYGRVVRALELMGLEGTSSQPEQREVEEKKEPVTVQNENVSFVINAEEAKWQPDVSQQNKPDEARDQVRPGCCTAKADVRNVSFVINAEEAKWQPDVSQQNKPDEARDQVRPGRKSFGGYSKRQSNRNRVKCDLQTWRNGGCSFRKDPSSQVNQDNRCLTNDQPCTTVQYFYANPTFSPQANVFDSYNNNGAPRQSSSYSASRENRYGRYTGYNGGSRNPGDRRSMGSNVQVTSPPQMEFWTSAYNDGQQSWGQ
uniref:Caprin-1_dimer domain-containing protein n=1 Tax=Caenorhabditis tropicalis TaxID=1561998 RepID=A0A1I7U063_9PELO